MRLLSFVLGTALVGLHPASAFPTDLSLSNNAVSQHRECGPTETPCKDSHLGDCSDEHEDCDPYRDEGCQEECDDCTPDSRRPCRLGSAASPPCKLPYCLPISSSKTIAGVCIANPRVADLCYHSMKIYCQAYIRFGNQGRGTWVQASTPEECVQRCNASPTCTSAMFETVSGPAGKYCYLNEDKPDVVSLTVVTPAPYYTFVKLVPVCTNGLYPGHTYVEAPAPTVK